MIDLSSLALLKGKKALVTGIAATTMTSSAETAPQSTAPRHKIS